jgi:hypothetical protein
MSAVSGRRYDVRFERYRGGEYEFLTQIKLKECFFGPVYSSLPYTPVIIVNQNIVNWSDWLSTFLSVLNAK